MGKHYSRRSVDRVVVIESKRIKKTRGDENTIKTGNPALAVRMVLKYFTPTPLSEQMREYRAGTRSMLSRIQGKVASDLTESVTNAVPVSVLGAYLLENIANYTAYVQTHSPKVSEALGKLNERLRAVEIVGSITDMTKQLTVWIKSNDEVVVSDDTDVVVYKEDELPASIKRKLGMLKLTENSQVVEHVGMRKDQNVFIIMKGE